MAEPEQGEIKFHQVGQLKTGSYVLIDGEACQIKDFEKSKPGKHGAAKARITGIGIFSGQKRTLMKPTNADTEVPLIKRGNAQVVAIMGDTVQIMDQNDYTTFDVEKPKDIQGLASGVECEYIKYGGQVKIVRKK